MSSTANHSTAVRRAHSASRSRRATGRTRAAAHAGTHSPRMQQALVGVVLLATGLSYWGAEHVLDLTLHHVGTLAAVAAMLWTIRRAPVSDGAFVPVVAFTLLHVVGAHWLYSFVPYDRWAQSLSGATLSETFGWQRNHFDRLIHFAFGLLVTSAAREVVMARSRIGFVAAQVFAISLIFAAGAVYECLEWTLSLFADPQSAENYNGQQGDVFDAQKDLAIAALGAAVATVVTFVRRR
jgi:putative membrane protein